MGYRYLLRPWERVSRPLVFEIGNYERRRVTRGAAVVIYPTTHPTVGASPADPKQHIKEPEMLVLSRHRDESIMIGDDVVITVVDIRGDKVRLGIQAPQDIPVHRQEVYEAIQRENRKAAQLQPTDTQPIAKPKRNDG